MFITIDFSNIIDTKCKKYERIEKNNEQYAYVDDIFGKGGIEP